MALSLESTWEPLDCLINPETGGPLHDQQSEVADALLGFFSDSLEPPHLANIDSLFSAQGDQLWNQTNSFMLPSFNHHPSFSAPSMLALPEFSFAVAADEFNLYPCPKRPRSCGDLYSVTSDLMRESGLNCAPVIGEPPMPNSAAAASFIPEFTAPLPPALVAPAACSGNRKTNGGNLSAQSAAARERRKRISEKTQELGKLIPGGNKMNTAEMFQAAYKYVKFLQAQVGVLDLLASMQGCEVPQVVDERLQCLLASTAMQEKLSAEGRCVVPKEAVEAMAKDQEIKSNILISRDLDRFMESMR